MPPIIFGTSRFNFSSTSSLKEALFPHKYIVDAAGCPPRHVVLGSRVSPQDSWS